MLGTFQLKIEYFTIIIFFDFISSYIYDMLRKDRVKFKQMGLFCLNMYFISCELLIDHRFFHIQALIQLHNII